MVPWYHGTMVPWYYGTMVPWYLGSMAPRYHGAMAHPSAGGWRPTFGGSGGRSSPVFGGSGGQKPPEFLTFGLAQNGKITHPADCGMFFVHPCGWCGMSIASWRALVLHFARLIRGCSFAIILVFFWFWGLCWAILASWEPIFKVPSSNWLHEELSRIESSINQVSVLENVRVSAVSWPSGATLSQTAKKKYYNFSQRKGSHG